MQIPPQITVSIKPDLYHAVLNTDMFKPGSTLKLKVLELRGDRALIDFGNFRATADVRIPVTLGEELIVRVQDFGRQLKLNLIHPEHPKALSADAPARSAEYLPAESFIQIQTDLKPILHQALASQNATKMPISILNIFKILNNHFEYFDLRENVAEIVARLKAYVENSGVFFEKFLENVIVKLSANAEAGASKEMTGFSDLQTLAARDLKTNLIMLQNFAENEMTLQKVFDTKTIAILRGVVDALLADIVHQQGRAVKQLDTTEPFQVFTFALPLKDDNHAAGLKIYYQKKQKSGSKKGVQISLLLSLDRLGDLRTDFYLLKKDLTVTFYVKDRPTKTKLQENHSELQELLAPFFDQLFLRVIVSEKKTKNFDHEDLQIASDRRVDLRI
ncbi:MAG: hypothetical protein JSW26_13960 [Desulfobacterales bacterium]|nr:MAG: hypothetical protein JSW26_13960 [Desulfobacterales bacterium]